MNGSLTIVLSQVDTFLEQGHVYCRSGSGTAHTSNYVSIDVVNAKDDSPRFSSENYYSTKGEDAAAKNILLLAAKQMALARNEVRVFSWLLGAGTMKYSPPFPGHECVHGGGGFDGSTSCSSTPTNVAPQTFGATIFYDSAGRPRTQHFLLQSNESAN